MFHSQLLVSPYTLKTAAVELLYLSGNNRQLSAQALSLIIILIRCKEELWNKNLSLKLKVMNSLQNQTYLIAYIISNTLAIIYFIAALKSPRVSRLLFLILFAWASYINWHTVIQTPKDYLNYADLTFLKVYKTFISGWFSDHLQIAVGFIATAQMLIAVSLLTRGWIYRISLIGGVIFLLAIIPLGIGSAFPCTLLLAIALGLLGSQDQYLWQRPNKKVLTSAH